MPALSFEVVTLHARAAWMLVDGEMTHSASGVATFDSGEMISFDCARYWNRDARPGERTTYRVTFYSAARRELTAAKWDRLRGEVRRAFKGYVEQMAGGPRPASLHPGAYSPASDAPGVQPVGPVSRDLTTSRPLCPVCDAVGAAQGDCDVCCPVRRDNVEYHAGRGAYAAGVASDACPYPAGGERAARWLAGWNDAPRSPDALYVVTGRSVDGTEWLTPAGFSTDRRAALLMSADDAAEIARREESRAAETRTPDAGTYQIKARPYSGPVLYTLADYESDAAESAALDALYGEAN